MYKQLTKEERLQLLERSLTNHRPSDEALERIESIRRHGKALGRAILEHSELSREQSLSLTHLEETVMWAVKGIVLEAVE